METAAVSDAAKNIAIGLPSLNFDLLADGLKDISPLLATAIPLGIYNFTEAMSNVESAASAGDDYNLRAVLLADGTGAVVGSALGCPFPARVVRRAAGLEAGRRPDLVLARHGRRDLPLLLARALSAAVRGAVPVPAIVPILLFIGLVIGAQSFAEVPKAHYAAVVLATVPNIAAWGSADRQRARGCRHERRRGGAQALAGRRPRLRRAPRARSRRRARRHGARCHRRVRDRPQVPLGAGYAMFGAALSLVA